MKVKPLCPYCGFSEEVIEGTIPAGLRWFTCQGCGQRFEFRVPEVERGIAPEGRGIRTDFSGNTGDFVMGLGKGAPWERRSHFGLFGGIFQTFKAVLFSPATFFKTLTPKGGMSEPLAFGLLLGGLGNILGIFWQFLMLGGGLESRFPGIFEEFNMIVIFFIIMALIPILVALAICLVSGVLHLMLLIVGGEKKGFEATFRVVAYSQASQAWAAIPFVGGWIGGIWQVIVQIIGLREMHETSYLKAIMAFVIPGALICLMGAAALILFFAFVGEHGLDLLKAFV